MYSGWKLSTNSITQLKNIFKPVHPNFIGHHITYMFGKDAVLPPEAEIYVIGERTTDIIQCLVVQVNGTIVRPDSKIYHITWSLDKSKGASPVMSNDALMAEGFKEIPDPILIYATPQIF